MGLGGIGLGRTARTVAGIVNHFNVDHTWNGYNVLQRVEAEVSAVHGDKKQILHGMTYQSQTIHKSHQPQMNGIPWRDECSAQE